MKKQEVLKIINITQNKDRAVLQKLISEKNNLYRDYYRLKDDVSVIDKVKREVVRVDVIDRA